MNVILAYYWDNGLPVIENIIGLFESSLKRTINDVIPHENLFLKYNLITDDEISKAKNEAEMANTAKSRFLSNMSKDILVNKLRV